MAGTFGVHLSGCRHSRTLKDRALEKVQAAAVEGGGGDAGAGLFRSWAHVVKAGPSVNELQVQEEIHQKNKDDEIRREEAAAKETAKVDAAKEASAKEAAAK